MIQGQAFLNQQFRYITFNSFKRGGIPSKPPVLPLVSPECYVSLSERNKSTQDDRRLYQKSSK